MVIRHKSDLLFAFITTFKTALEKQQVSCPVDKAVPSFLP
jgi:hypothetical protein